jgi:hypothetical protein
MSDPLAWLVDQWSWVTAAIVIPLTWFLGRVGVLATKRTDRWLERKVDQWVASRAKRKKAKEQRRRDEQRAAELRKLEGERVGVRFLVRESKDDPGTLIEVIGIDPKARKARVRAIPLDRSDDPPVTLIAWDTLTRPADQQRHATARLDADSYDDNDGWVRYERVDPQTSAESAENPL